MTRTEFFEEVNDWSDLMNFADHVGYTLGDIFFSGDESSYVEDDINDYVRYRYDWEELKDILDGLDFSGEVYDRVDSFEYDDITDKFEEYKEYLADYCDNHDYWDEEDEEVEEENEEAEEDEEDDEVETEDEVFEDDVTLAEFLMPSVAVA